MSKHSKHGKHHHKNEEHKADHKKSDTAAQGDANVSMIAALENEDTKPDAQAGAESEDPNKGIFENIAKLNGKKSGGHEPVSFIPPNEPMDHSAQASLDAHEVAKEDKDPSEVQQELSHKEILDGALQPSSPESVTKDLPDAGKNPDAEVKAEAPADEKKGEEPGNASVPDALTQPSTDGSEKVDGANPPAPVDPIVPTDAGTTPSAA